MLFLPKHFEKLLILLALWNTTFAQEIRKVIYKDSTAYYQNKEVVYLNKIIPREFDDAIQTALQYYPELSNTRIRFRIKKRNSPLAARPALLSVFKKPSGRKYIITISCSTSTKLTPVLLKNLSFNSQAGVIGHELAHISCYNTKRGIYFFGLALKHLDKYAIDKFEFDTDKRCIEHGLGFQLLSWSNEVRSKLMLLQWGGANNPKGKRERYMNPQTISMYLDSLPIYIHKLK